MWILRLKGSRKKSLIFGVEYHLCKLCIHYLQNDSIYALIQTLYVKNLFSLIYKFLVLTLFDKIRTCFEILA